MHCAANWACVTGHLRTVFIGVPKQVFVVNLPSLVGNDINVARELVVEGRRWCVLGGQPFCLLLLVLAGGGIPAVGGGRCGRLTPVDQQLIRIFPFRKNDRNEFGMSAQVTCYCGAL